MREATYEVTMFTADGPICRWSVDSWRRLADELAASGWSFVLRRPGWRVFDRPGFQGRCMIAVFTD